MWIDNGMRSLRKFYGGTFFRRQSMTKDIGSGNSRLWRNMRNQFLSGMDCRDNVNRLVIGAAVISYGGSKRRLGVEMIVQITDRAWCKLAGIIRPGLRDIDITAAGYQAMIEGGAEIGGVVPVFSGPNTFERGIAMTDRFIQPGDIVYGDITNFGYLGYKTCLYRTFIAGRKPNQQEKDLYKKLLDTQNAILDAIKPGNTTADAAKAFKPASTWGYPDEDHVFTIEIGHGIGLYLYEPPIINQLWSLNHPQPFEVGNVIAVEHREGEAGVGVRLEDMVVVTENGAELLSRFPRDEIIVAGAIV